MHYVERSRTTVGDKLFEELRAKGLALSETFAELAKRIEVRISDEDEGFGIAHTRLDGGEEVNEGYYLLSGKAE